MKRDKVRRRKLMLIIRRDWQLYLFLLLPLAYIVIFKYVPMLGLQIAFRDYTPKGGIWGSEWVGLDNVIKFMESYQFGRVVRNTFLLSVYGLTLNTVIPIAFALIYNCIELPRFKKVSQTIVTLPHFISVVVLVGIMMQLLNSRTGIYGILYEKITGQYPGDLFGNPDAFRHLYVWSGIWQMCGWDSIIYFASLAGVDESLHEAAIVDGATITQRIRFIDLPSLKPTIVTLFIMNTGKIMSIGFEKAYLMQNSLNLETSEIIATYVYKIGLLNQQYSYSTAINLFNSIVNLILLLTVNVISKKLSDTSII